MDSDTTIPNDDLMNEADSIFPDSEEDVSLIDYARYHGLSKDYTCSYPLSGYHLQSYPDWECLGANNLTDFVLPDAVDLEEKWIIDRPSVIFLKQVLPVEAVPFPKSTSKRAYFKDFKIEPPLLPTDPELGQRRFMQRRIKRQNRGLRMMSQETDWQDVESAQLYWPSLNLPVELLTEIKQEKLQLGKGDILFLQQCMSSVEKPKFEEINEPPRKKMRDEYESARHTSPLLPCSSPFHFGIPGSPASRMPLATSPIDPVPAEISRLEDIMDVEDDFSLDSFSDTSAFDVEATNEFYTHPLLKRKQLENFKAEVPLSPAWKSSSPLKRIKIAAFSDELCTLIPDYAKPFSSEDPRSTDEKYTDFFDQVIEPGAKSAIHAIQNEQLTEADSTMRAEVPTVDQTGPLPPWEVFGRKQMGGKTEIEAQQQLICMLKREMIKPREAWPSVGRIDRAITRWRPFDMRLDELPKEGIECDYLDEFGARKPEDTTAGWKPDGLRILDASEDDDEEISVADMEITLDNMQMIDDVQEVKARSFIENGKHPVTSQPTKSFSFLPRMTEIGPGKTSRPFEIVKNPPQPGLGGAFSASDSLDRYIQLNTGKKTILTLSDDARLQIQTPSKDDLKLPEKLPRNEKPLDKAQSRASMHLPHLPHLPSSMPNRYFVLSSTMFGRRALVKEIKRLMPSAESIERDFASNRHGMSSQTSEADEADIILAPGHGVMLTSLQKLKQKSLPGDAMCNKVRERIVQLARRYERLIIMVNEDGSGNQQRALDGHDCSELVSLINFCAAQSHEMQVMYVPGDELALASWIVACMVRFGLDDTDVQLLQDETSWEVFLRKAGMDAYAAQVVLTKLKMPEPKPSRLDERDYGMPAFVMMGEAERLRRFGSLFGGEKILKKVSMAIDGCWTRGMATSTGDLERQKL